MYINISGLVVLNLIFIYNIFNIECVWYYIGDILR